MPYIYICIFDFFHLCLHSNRDVHEKKISFSPRFLQVHLTSTTAIIWIAGSCATTPTWVFVDNMACLFHRSQVSSAIDMYWKTAAYSENIAFYSIK